MSIATELTAAEEAAAVPARPSNLHAWLIVLFLMLLLTSSFIDRTILSLMVKPIRHDLNLTDTEYSYLAGLAFVVLYTITGIPLGWLADRWRGRLVVGDDRELRPGRHLLAPVRLAHRRRYRRGDLVALLLCPDFGA